VLSGEFQVVNQHLLRDLTELNLWNEDLKNAIISNNGSIQNIEVPYSLASVTQVILEVDPPDCSLIFLNPEGIKVKF